MQDALYKDSCPVFYMDSHTQTGYFGIIHTETRVQEKAEA